MTSQNEPVEPALKIDLHGYHPKDIVGEVLAKLVEQAWEKGATRLCLIHGHGRARGRSPGFYNTLLQHQDRLFWSRSAAAASA